MKVMMKKRQNVRYYRKWNKSMCSQGHRNVLYRVEETYICRKKEKIALRKKLKIK